MNTTNITYSFIIPHHNTPDLLNRCLDSIPQREDIQIIVVDDNSEVLKKPHVNRKDVEVLYIDANDTKGAGHARNIGLAKAKGKWLLFADADDYYVEGFLKILDEYIDQELDVLYYNYLRLIDGKDGYIKEQKGIQEIIAHYNESANSVMKLKYRNHAPWSKMVSREYVVNGCFYFESVPNGNDTLFSYFVGYNAKKFKVDKRAIYVYTLTEGSITQKKKNKKDHLSRLMNITKNNSFYNEIGCSSWCSSAYRYMFNVLKNYGVFEALRVFFIYLKKYQHIKSQKLLYVDKVIKRI